MDSNSIYTMKTFATALLATILPLLVGAGPVASANGDAVLPPLDPQSTVDGFTEALQKRGDHGAAYFIAHANGYKLTWPEGGKPCGRTSSPLVKGEDQNPCNHAFWIQDYGGPYALVFRGCGVKTPELWSVDTKTWTTGNFINQCNRGWWSSGGDAQVKKGNTGCDHDAWIEWTCPYDESKL